MREIEEVASEQPSNLPAGLLGLAAKRLPVLPLPADRSLDRRLHVPVFAAPAPEIGAVQHLADSAGTHLPEVERPEAARLLVVPVEHDAFGRLRGAPFLMFAQHRIRVPAPEVDDRAVEDGMPLDPRLAAVLATPLGHCVPDVNRDVVGPGADWSAVRAEERRGSSDHSWPFG